MLASSVAVTENVWGPSGSASVVYGEEHVTAGPESTWQLKVEPGSEEAKVNVGVESAVSPPGPPVMVVFGGVLSGTRSNAAVTDRLSLIVTLHELVPEQAPLQPVKLEPAAGVAESVTSVPAV